MLKQIEIDAIKMDLLNGDDVYLYYVANVLELRQDVKARDNFKSANEYRVIKVKVANVENALFELFNFKNNPDQYHEEVEEEYYDKDTRYIHYYTVKNEYDNSKPFNARYPSTIYGMTRKIYDKDGNLHEFNDRSPVSIIYTNNPSLYLLQPSEAKQMAANGELDWKYYTYDVPVETDGIKYKYATSNYYVLDIANFPFIEKPLINVNEKCSFFLDLDDAFNHLNQLKD